MYWLLLVCEKEACEHWWKTFVLTTLLDLILMRETIVFAEIQ